MTRVLMHLGHVPALYAAAVRAKNALRAARDLGRSPVA